MYTGGTANPPLRCELDSTVISLFFLLSTCSFGAAGCRCFAGLASLVKASDIIGEAHTFHSPLLQLLDISCPPSLRIYPVFLPDALPLYLGIAGRAAGKKED